MSVAERQNSDDALLFVRAAQRRYALARLWRAIRIDGALAFAVAGPVVAHAADNATPYIAAGAAAWALAGRVLAAAEGHARRQAVRAQEMFDTLVFGLGWNPGAAGERPSREEVCDWADNERSTSRNWYPPVLAAAPTPIDVLLCQRSSVVWSRRDHQVMRFVALALPVLLFVGSLIYAASTNLGLDDYLLQWGLPLLPGALDVADVALDNHRLVDRKRQLEREIEALLDRFRSGPDAPTLADCRLVQDRIVETRLLPGVPLWWYRITHVKRERAMYVAAEGYLRDLGIAPTP